jgi:CheY-like chemotaxis protein
MVAPNEGSYEILIVEDNPGDARLLREALESPKARNSMSVVRDGEEALRFLRREGPYQEAPRPDVIFLDLNLPKKDGREVLQEIKHNPMVRRIPVIVITTSDAEQDVIRAYDLHANCYVKKPVDLDSFFAAVKASEDYWLGLVRLPKG